MRNISSILSSHNRKIFEENEKQYECNCRNKDEYPLENICLTPRVICEVDVITLNTSRRFYVGLSDTKLKSVIITISVILETNFTRKILSFQNIFRACKKMI